MERSNFHAIIDGKSRPYFILPFTEKNSKTSELCEEFLKDNQDTLANAITAV